MTIPLQIETVSLGPIQTNAYIVTHAGAAGRCFVVDPGVGPGALIARIRERQWKVEAIVLTHAHFDHMGGVDEVRKAFGCPVYVHPLEADWLTDSARNGSLRWAEVTPPLTTAVAEFDLADGQKLNLLELPFIVMHTPGHSPGSCSLYYGGHLLSGDVLFRQSVGRVDLPGGREQDLIDSIRLKLYALPEETVVYPGHGARTTIGYEKVNNPYVRG